jgi:hypothetical protein
MATKHVNLPLDPEMHNKLVDMAERKRRSMNGQVEVYIEEGLARDSLNGSAGSFEGRDRDMYRADPIGMSRIVAAAEAAPPDSPEGKRARWARWCFERWAGHTIVSTCRDWDELSVTERAIWIDMVAMMEGKI